MALRQAILQHQRRKREGRTCLNCLQPAAEPAVTVLQRPRPTIGTSVVHLQSVKLTSEGAGSSIAIDTVIIGTQTAALGSTITVGEKPIAVGAGDGQPYAILSNSSPLLVHPTTRPSGSLSASLLRAIAGSTLVAASASHCLLVADQTLEVESSTIILSL